MFCGFKYCRGRGACFLEGNSPCSEHAKRDRRQGEWAEFRPTHGRRRNRAGFIRVAGPAGDVAAHPAE